MGLGIGGGGTQISGGVVKVSGETVTTIAPGFLSTLNSTSTPLGIGGVYTGSASEVANYKCIGIVIKSNVASATNGFQLQFSPDGTNWDVSQSFTIPAATGKYFNFPVEGRYFRVIYTNGAVAQTYFRLQAILHASMTKQSTLRIADDIDGQEAAELIRAILTGETPGGSYTNVNVTAAGNLKVSLEEWDVGISGLIVGVSGQVVKISGETVQVSGQVMKISGETIQISRSGYIAGVDRTAGTLQTIEYEHHEIHEGKMYNCFVQTSGLADDGTLSLLLITGSGQEVHAYFNQNCGGDAWFEIRENVVLSGDYGSGSPVTVHCMNRYVSGSSKTTVYKDPYRISGQILYTAFIPGGSGPKAAGGGGRGNNEWILTGVSGPINYVASIINVAGAIKDTSLDVNFYEKTPGY